MVNIKKNDLKPWQKHQWCLTHIDGEFIARMEALLDLYELPYNPHYPVICLDERPCQLIGNVMIPLQVKPGQVQKEDYHYKRNGTCVVFIAVEPLQGFRMIRVFKQRTKREYTLFKRELASKYPHAKRIRTVEDNLNTHTFGSFYETLPVEEAHRLMNRFEFHYTPKKASWLNMAEIEIAALSKQCLDRRIPSLSIMKREVKAFEKKRNRKKIKIQWRFTTPKARIKLERHYKNLN